jgi:predicted DNA-binding antitoxin AbrB/MazE fold protein
MVRQLDAIFSQGVFRPLEPLALPEGTRVHLSVEEQTSASPAQSVPMLRTPKLARREDVADFVMEVRETGNDGVRRHSI